MDNMFEVERDDYIAFIGQLDKQKMDLEEYAYKDCNFLKIISKKTGTHLSTRVIYHGEDEGKEQYFIFSYPDADERITPKPVWQLKLESKEEVQTFFNILNKMQEKKNE